MGVVLTCGCGLDLWVWHVGMWSTGVGLAKLSGCLSTGGIQKGRRGQDMWVWSGFVGVVVWTELLLSQWW